MSSLDCPKSPISGTSIEQKQKSKQAAQQRSLVNLTQAEWKELLREKCRTRIKQARHNCFTLTRDVNKIYNPSVEEFLKEQILEQQIVLEDEIYTELKEELDKWLIQQYEEDENSYLKDILENEMVVCPICEMAAIVFDKELKKFRCNRCPCCFDFNGKMKQLRDDLRTKMDEHAATCHVMLEFFIEPMQIKSDSDEWVKTLSGICNKCNYFCSF